MEAKIIKDLGNKVSALETQLQAVSHENVMYQKYIESLLSYNEQLIAIIEKELQVGHKISRLQSISEKSDNFECKSYTVKMAEDNESLLQSANASNNLNKIQGEINMLLELYNDKFAKNKEVAQLQLKEVMGLMESDKQEYRAFHQNSIERLQSKESELAVILNELRSSIEGSVYRNISDRMRTYGA